MDQTKVRLDILRYACLMAVLVVTLIYMQKSALKYPPHARYPAAILCDKTTGNPGSGDSALDLTENWSMLAMNHEISLYPRSQQAPPHSPEVYARSPADHAGNFRCKQSGSWRDKDRINAEYFTSVLQFSDVTGEPLDIQGRVGWGACVWFANADADS
ncbi:hypothetical protein Bbelb_034040 [Branchiostoma belcheri]|nr:hypothetical protein Bbelb_034040 [Branchiostoma belcheri]